METRKNCLEVWGVGLHLLSGYREKSSTVQRLASQKKSSTTKSKPGRLVFLHAFEKITAVTVNESRSKSHSF